MKKLFKNSLLLLALLSVLFTSCRKDYPEPPIDILPVGDVITIDSLLKITPGTTFRDDCSLYGIVTMDEQSGNLYKAAFIQDRRTGAAVELYMDATSGLHVGDSIRVYLKDVTFDMYNGLPQLSGFSADGHIIILDNERPIQPTLTTIGEIVEGGDKYLGRLVRLENVMFAGKNTFADPTGYGERTLLDPMDLQHSAIVRTSNYANFAKDSLPQGTGNLVVIASLYKTNSRETWQFLIRSAKELEFEGYSPGSGLPYFQEFSSDFGTYTTYSVAGDQEWEIDYSTAKMTGHVGSGNFVNEDWLISSPVAITGVEHAKVCVNYAAQYQNSNTEDVTLQISKNYVAGTDPMTADWIQMPVTYPNTASWSEVKTVETSLDEFIGQTVTVAIKFTSSETQSRTIEIKYIAIMEGEANGVTPTPPSPSGELQNMPYTQSFATDFGTYMAFDAVGPQSWVIDFSTAKMSGYEGGTNYINEDWLISSPVAVTNVESAKASVTYVAQYRNSDVNDVTLQVSTDYVFGNDPASANWTQMPTTYPNTGGWQDFQTVETSLNDFIGQNITVAVKFTSTDSQSRTMEVQSITIQEGGGVTPTPPGPGGDVQSLPYAQSFETEFGTYLTKDVLGSQSWEIKYSSATMTGYVNPSYYANEDWLISSPVDLSGVNAAKMTIEYIGRYFNNINNDVTIWASTDYTWDAAPSSATWRQVPATLREATNWTDFLKTEISLIDVTGQPLVGQTVTFAVKYVSTNDKAGTMEVKSILIEEGGDTPTPPTPGPGGDLQNMPYTQSFATEFGTYTTFDMMGPQSWVIDYSTAKMTGYAGGSHANEDWLISSPVAVTGVEHAMVSVTYSAQYQNSDANDVTLKVSSNYVFGNDPSTATWTTTNATYPNTSSFNDFKTVETSLDAFIGQNVTVAIIYTSTDAQSRTIEIQSITVQEGGGVGPTPPPTPGPGNGSGTYDDPYDVAAGISNQGQSGVWVQGYIVGCVKSGTDHNTVTSNADIDWSAPFGRATNVLIADDASCNELSQCLIVKLPKSTPLRTQVNLVDHPENLGKLLTVKGTLGNGFGKPGVTDCPGAQGDFVLEGGDNPTPPPTPPTGIFSETFANGQGQFVIKDVNLPSALTFVWAHNSTYSCMKGSAFKNQAYEAESWLVSPAIDLSDVSTASLSFEQAVNYASPQGALSVMISTDYAGEVSQSTWAELRLNQWPSGSDWTFITSTTDLTSYAGQTVTIAFKYTSTSSASCTWEVRNIVVE